MDTKDKQCDYYIPPFGGMETFCHNRHKTVPEFILILYDVDENHIRTFTDLRFARTVCQLRAF